jgi:hypothetical protein
VGEGALDDSDSSESDDGQQKGKAEGESSDEESGLRPLISPYQSTRVVPATPSPLSHVAGQQRWTEDEEDDEDDNDEASPSPGSTDTESSGSDGSAQRKKTKAAISRRNSHAKSRSRSSTVASLPASSVLHVRKSLTHKGSGGSIQTVTVGEPDSKEDTAMDTMRSSGKTITPESRKIQRSQTVSNDLASNAPEEADDNAVESSQWNAKTNEKRKLGIMAEEAKLREMGWEILREALGRFAEEGDVQICCMLSVLAPQELRVEKKKIIRFLESYICSYSRQFIDRC